MFLGAILLAAITANEIENPRWHSANGEMCVVVRNYPVIGDFEHISVDEYWRRMESATEEPPRGALYRLWPGEYRELLAEFPLARGEGNGRVLVADDGHSVMYGQVECGATAELLTIRAADGSVVRTLRVRDVLTANDQQWLCRGIDGDVGVSLGEETLRIAIADGSCDEGRQHTIDVDLETGDVAAPDRDHCPAALCVVPEADDALPGHKVEKDVVSISSQELLDRAVVRVLPEYPDIAARARISGRVGVQVVVSAGGRVESAEVVKPLPFGLDQAVRSAIEKWKFAPDASRVSAVLVFRFELLRDIEVRAIP